MASAVLLPPDVMVVGSLHLDIVVASSHLPAIDETVRGSQWGLVCGGKGGNQACWAARFGARTGMISRVGRDDFGNRLLANLDRCGVDRSGVSIDETVGSGMSVAIVDERGDYGAVIVSGSNLAIPETDALAALQANAAPKLLVLQNEISDDLNLAVARWARDHAVPVLLNAAPARPLSAAMTACIDILVVNRVEAAMMCGRTVSNRVEAREAVALLRAFARHIVITLGGEGLVVAEADGDAEDIAPERVEVVSTHGAGDCFVARLAAGLAAGEPLPLAARHANASAARYVAGELSLTAR